MLTYHWEETSVDPSNTFLSDDQPRPVDEPFVLRIRSLRIIDEFGSKMIIERN
jgi:hypothetical protein